MHGKRSARRERVRAASSLARRSGFTWIELAAVLGVIALLIALLLPAQRRARPAAHRTQCKNNLKQIGLALYNYHDAHGAFPPAYTVDAGGRRLHSWRTLILPYVDQADLYNKVDFSNAWDDPANAEVFKTMPQVYNCPSATVPQRHTTYLAVVTANSCLRATGSRTLSEVTDKPAETLMVIEVLQDQAVHWMAPQDADEAILQSFRSDSKETHTGGRHALLADGAVRFLSQKIDRSTLQALVTATGSETVGEF